MKRFSLLAVAGSLFTLMPLLPLRAQAQDMFTLEDQLPRLAQSITLSPLITASAPSIRTALLSQSNVGPGQPNNVAGFMFADNNGGPVVSYGTNLNNTVITDAQDGTALDTLTLTFAQPVSGLTFSFATIPVTPGNLITLSATTNNAAVFASNTGVFNAISTDNEGSLTLTGGTFNILNLFLSGTATIGDSFAVDNFIVTPSVTVPEPGSLALLAGMLVPVAWSLRRRKAAGIRH